MNADRVNTIIATLFTWEKIEFKGPIVCGNWICVDLPRVTELLKIIDNNNFYKTNRRVSNLNLQILPNTQFCKQMFNWSPSH